MKSNIILEVLSKDEYNSRNVGILLTRTNSQEDSFMAKCIICQARTSAKGLEKRWLRCAQCNKIANSLAAAVDTKKSLA